MLDYDGAIIVIICSLISFEGSKGFACFKRVGETTSVSEGPQCEEAGPNDNEMYASSSKSSGPSPSPKDSSPQ